MVSISFTAPEWGVSPRIELTASVSALLLMVYFGCVYFLSYLGHCLW